MAGVGQSRIRPTSRRVGEQHDLLLKYIELRKIVTFKISCMLGQVLVFGQVRKFEKLTFNGQMDTVLKIWTLKELSYGYANVHRGSHLVAKWKT